jgi:hypothetical protein
MKKLTSKNTTLIQAAVRKQRRGHNTEDLSTKAAQQYPNIVTLNS